MFTVDTSQRNVLNGLEQSTVCMSQRSKDMRIMISVGFSTVDVVIVHGLVQPGSIWLYCVVKTCENTYSKVRSWVSTFYEQKEETEVIRNVNGTIRNYHMCWSNYCFRKWRKVVRTIEVVRRERFGARVSIFPLLCGEIFRSYGHCDQSFSTTHWETKECFIPQLSWWSLLFQHFNIF